MSSLIVDVCEVEEKEVQPGADQFDLKRRKNWWVTHDYFSVIDSPTKAYFVGLLLTDGNVYGNRLTLELQSMDASVIERLKAELCLTSKLYERPNYESSRLSVRSEQLVSDLGKLGVVQNKTHIASAPVLHESLVRHFWRGVIDGDGSIKFRQGNRRISVSLELCGSHELVCQFKTFCESFTDRKYKVYKPCSIYYYRVFGKNALVVLDELYNTSEVVMQRKRDTYTQIKSYYATVVQTSKFKGVCWDKARESYQAYARFGGRRVHLGRFASESEAAKARDLFVVDHLPHLGLNFPDGEHE